MSLRDSSKGLILKRVTPHAPRRVVGWVLRLVGGVRRSSSARTSTFTVRARRFVTWSTGTSIKIWMGGTPPGACVRIEPFLRVGSFIPHRTMLCSRVVRYGPGNPRHDGPGATESHIVHETLFRVYPHTNKALCTLAGTRCGICPGECRTLGAHAWATSIHWPLVYHTLFPERTPELMHGA